MTKNTSPDLADLCRIVPERSARAYLRLCDAGGVPDHEAAAFLGGEDVKQELKDYGLARTIPFPNREPPLFTPMKDGAAQLGVLGALAGQLTRTLGLMDDAARQAIDAHWRALSAGPGKGRLGRIIEDPDQVAEESACFVSRVHEQFLTIDTGRTESNPDRPFPVEPPALAPDVKTIGMYAESFIADPAGQEYVKAAIRRGERVRIIPDFPTKLQIADRSAVLVALSPTGHQGVMLVESTAFADVMHLLAKLLWDYQSRPLGTDAKVDGNPLTEFQQTLLTHLANGLRSEKIGEEVGLSTSRVYHRFAEIADIVHAKTREQALAIAVRRRWIS